MTFMVFLQTHAAERARGRGHAVPDAICRLCPVLIFCILIKSVVSVAIQSHSLTRNTVKSQQRVKWYFKINGGAARRGILRPGADRQALKSNNRYHLPAKRIK